jgi:hypothetical protein
MAEEALEQALLQYFVHDEWAARGYQPMSSIIGQLGSPAGRAHDYVKHIDLPSRDEFVRTIEQMANDGLLDMRVEADGVLAYAASEHGIYEASIGRVLVLDEASETAPSPAQVDSRKWTGGRLVLTDEIVIARVRDLAGQLRDKVHQTSFEKNSDSHDLKSLADALVSVVAMTEPELTIIERILNHPKFKLSATLIAAVATIRGALGI